MQKLIIIIFSIFLVACGNADRYVNNNQLATSKHLPATPLTTAFDSPDTSFHSCLNLTVNQGDPVDATLSTLFSGISACQSSSDPRTVKVVVPANFPPTDVFCLVPQGEYDTGAVWTYPPATLCTEIIGQKVFNFNVVTKEINSVTLLRQQDYSKYLDYIKDLSNNQPARAYGRIAPVLPMLIQF